MVAGNIHATAVVLGDRGILIQGDSGSGKSTLALALVTGFVRAGRFARLVADDQVMVEARRGRLLAHTPESIAGLGEIHGLGPRAMEHEGTAVVDLVVSRCTESESGGRQIDAILTNGMLPDMSREFLTRMMEGKLLAGVRVSVADNDLNYSFADNA